jgi:FMN phosphatase YigB (HAD superfamily)
MASFAAGHPSEADMADLSRRHFRGAGARVDDALAVELGDVFGRADVARFRPPEDVAARVEAFRRAGYRLAAVSNTMTRPALLEAFLAEVGLLPLFETLAFSCAVGVRKPHPDIYGAALSALELEAGQVVFVGDRVREDVRGPQSLGMRAVLTHEFRQEAPGDSGPLAVVGRLDDLHGVLGKV